VIFFFQAEDGIRDKLVTGVQTCALPISADADEVAFIAILIPMSKAQKQLKAHFIGICGVAMSAVATALWKKGFKVIGSDAGFFQIGRASCRERVEMSEGAMSCERRES